jgi:hypothetical protein
VGSFPSRRRKAKLNEFMGVTLILAGSPGPHHWPESEKGLSSQRFLLSLWRRRGSTELSEKIDHIEIIN